MKDNYWFQSAAFLLFLIPAVFLSIKSRKLTPVGGTIGGLIACLIYLGAGFTGIALLAAFFLLGTGATSWQRRTKEQLGAGEERQGQRTAGQVLANGGIAGLLGLLAWVWPEHADLCRLMMAGSLAAATADTLSSELGTVYGSRFYNILTFRKDRRGENGVISLEGTLIGIAGSTLIACIYGIGYGWSHEAAWIIVGGTAGNLADSVLGATLERKGVIGNNAVNTLNTLTGALIAGLVTTIQ